MNLTRAHIRRRRVFAFGVGAALGVIVGLAMLAVDDSLIPLFVSTPLLALICLAGTLIGEPGGSTDDGAR